MKDCNAIDSKPADAERVAATSRHQLAFRHCGIAFAITGDAVEDVVGPLHEALPSAVSLSIDTGTADVRYAIDRWQPGATINAGGYRVCRNGALRYLGRSPERLVQWLRADMQESAARHSGARVALGAVAVAWRGRAIIILGPDPSATRRLRAALIRLGAAPCGNDQVLIDVDGRVIPAASLSEASTVALIVSTTYRSDASWLPRRLRGARAVLPILEQKSPNAIELRDLLRVCASLADSVLTLQGQHGDASMAAPQILAAVDECVDARTYPTPLLADASSVLARACQALGPPAGDAKEPQGSHAQADAPQRVASHSMGSG